jgi:isoleucyl-tRNA synthetase
MEIHRLQRLLHGYLSGDVSAFHAHVLKDRLYCDRPDGAGRRAAQQVLFEIARECCQLLAPILCFTADEAWEKLPAWPGKPDSVHLAAWAELPATDDALAFAWEDVIAVRSDVLKALELARAAGLIGDPLEAAVTVGVSGARRRVLESRHDAMAEACVVSSLTLAADSAAAPDGAHPTDGGWVLVERAAGRKCPRCWAFREDHAGIPGHPDCCRRCSEVVTALGVTVDPA